MTHTVHPYAHRLGIIRDWKSRWFAADSKSYRENIKLDEVIRRYLTKKLRGTYTSGIEIERSESTLRIIVSTARPGLVIGRSGENAAKLNLLGSDRHLGLELVVQPLAQQPCADHLPIFLVGESRVAQEVAIALFERRRDRRRRGNWGRRRERIVAWRRFLGGRRLEILS